MGHSESERGNLLPPHGLHVVAAKKRSFNSGDKVLLLLPIPKAPLQARYFGPYLVHHKFSSTGYIVLERERNVLFNNTLNTFIYGYMASDIWLRTILIVRKETHCHIGYSYQLTPRVLLYAPSHRQDSTYHSLYYTSRGALAGTRNSSMGLIVRNDHLLYTTTFPCMDHSPCFFTFNGPPPVSSNQQPLSRGKRSTFSPI